MKILHTLCSIVILVVCISCSRIDPVDLQSLTQYALIKNVTGEEVMLVLSPYKYSGAESSVTDTVLLKNDEVAVVAAVDLVYHTSIPDNENLETLLQSVLPKYVSVEFLDGSKYEYFQSSAMSEQPNPTYIQWYEAISETEYCFSLIRNLPMQ